MDSASLFYQTLHFGFHVIAASVNYGQRHAREIDSAKALVKDAQSRFVHLKIEHVDIDLTALGQLLSGSSLTDESINVPEGHYSEESMRSTVVPNRNMILIAAAGGIAVAAGARQVRTAVHAGDHFVYPDCRPVFIGRVSDALREATKGFGDVAVVAPYQHITKADIALLGASAGVPFELTWSCYQGGELHCGRCGTCVERAEAFAISGVPDPTEYEDPDYWLAVVQAKEVSQPTDWDMAEATTPPFLSPV